MEPRSVLEHRCGGHGVPLFPDSHRDETPGGANPSSPGPKKGETQQETSKLDFDKSLWRHVPVPKYDPDSKLHRSVAEAAREMEQGASESGWAELDRCVSALLPDYATH